MWRRVVTDGARHSAAGLALVQRGDCGRFLFARCTSRSLSATNDPCPAAADERVDGRVGMQGAFLSLSSSF